MASSYKSGGNGSYSGSDRPSVGAAATEADFAGDPAAGGFFAPEFRKHDDLKTMLDSNKDGLKLEAMKRIIGMVAKGKDASDLFPAVVKNVVSKNIEVKKLVYVYLVRYAEEQQDLALLSISTFQRALKDPNQLIRASALRVLSSIRVPVIVPIMMLAIKDAVNDMSPYVRKTAAHAIPKLYSLDPEQKDQLIEVIEKLLSDKTTLVMGSAVMAFEEVCPEKNELIHKNYRKLCNLLVDVEEWGQVVIMNMLTRYARTQFVDPNKYDTSEVGEEKAFYESDSSEVPDNANEKKTLVMDSDHRLLLRNCKPLLQSRNSAVVMSVVQLYYYLAPKNEVNMIAKALIRLTKSHREIQSVVLGCIATLSTKHKGMFEPYIKSFFVRSNDPTHIKILKLEILTNLASESNISFILREFQTYVSSPDMDFVAATIQAIGRCASSISDVTDTCLNGLVSLLSNRNEAVVAESVVVIKKLLQMQLTDHKDIIVHMSRLMDTLTIPMARASILWLLGEYADKVTKIAPDVLRKVAKNFANEENIVKLQAVTLAAKLYLTNQKQTKLLVQYVFNLAKYDLNYDIRDRTRFLRQLIMPANEKGQAISKYAKKILLTSKPAPVLQSKFRDRDQYQLGSLSHYINSRAAGYQDLPGFPEEPPDSSVRNVEVQMPWQEPELVLKKKQPVKKKAFYSETESSSPEEGDVLQSSASEGSASDNESDAAGDEEKSTSEDESDSGSEDEESEDEESEEADSAKKEKEVSTDIKKKPVVSKVVKHPVRKASSTEESDSVVSSDSEEESETSSESEQDIKPDSKKKKDKMKSKITKVPMKKKKSEENKKDIDLLLDLDDFSTPSAAPVIQPSVLTALPILSPSANINEKIVHPTALIASTVSAAYIPVEKHELLNKYSGKGLSVSYRFTRTPNLFSAKMTTIELTLSNASSEDICDVHVPDKKVGSLEVKGFPSIAIIAPNSTIPVTMAIDYNESTQPAKFDVKTSKNTFSLSIKAPVGELLQPVMLSEGEFEKAQTKLKGMNENVGIVDLSSGNVDANALVRHIYEAANIMQVQNVASDANTIRFSSQTLGTKSLVLVAVQILNNAKVSITVNCEKMVIGSMLLKELKKALAK